MYKVIEMYGDVEPWWFLEDWEEDVVSTKTFDDYYQALKYYKVSWLKREKEFPFYQSRSDLMTIFWDPKDKRWCEECDEYLQQYHSLVLLEDDRKVSKSKFRPGYRKQNAKKYLRLCKRK